MGATLSLSNKGKMTKGTGSVRAKPRSPVRPPRGQYQPGLPSLGLEEQMKKATLAEPRRQAVRGSQDQSEGYQAETGTPEREREREAVQQVVE